MNYLIKPKLTHGLNQLKLIADTNLNDSMNNNYMTYLKQNGFF